MPAQVVALIGDPIVIVATGPADGAAPSIVYANPGFARLIGRNPDAMLSQPLRVLASAITDPLELARLIDAVERRRAIDFSLQIAAAGGRRLWTKVQGRPLEGEGRPYLVHLRDVSAHRAVVQTAQRLERRFDALAKLSSDAVYHLRVDPDCRLTLDWTAGAFERLTGYNAAELEALGGWAALVEPADRRLVQRRAQKFIAGEQASAEYRIKSRDGARRWLRDAGWPQWDAARELVVGVLCAAQDITERRRLEEQVQAQQLERRSLISLSDGLLCETDGAGRLQAVAGDAEGELAARLRGGVGRSLEEVIGPEHAAIWRHHLEGLLPGWAPVSFTLVHQTEFGEERCKVRLCAAPGSRALARVLPPSGLIGRGEMPQIAVPTDPRLRALLELQRSAAVLLAPS